MKKKTEVHVKVDSAKVARKLAKTLKMFKEPVFFLSIERWETGEAMHGANTGAIFLDEQSQAQWAGTSNYRGRTEVSVKELRAILAAEHLKAGDVVVCKGSKTFIIEVDSAQDKYLKAKHVYCVEEKQQIKFLNIHMYLDTFKRYATEAETALLKGQEPKAETLQEEGARIHREFFERLTGENGQKPKAEQLEDNTWYYSDDCGEQLIYRTTQAENGNYKGIVRGVWREYLVCSDPKTWKKATYEQVNTALLAEAQKRYKVGDVVKCLTVGIPPEQCTIESFEKENHFRRTGALFVTGEEADPLVFEKGKWAEVVRKAEKPESAEKQVQPESKPESTVGRWVVVGLPDKRDPDCTRNAVVLDKNEYRATGYNFGGEYTQDFNIERAKSEDWPMREATPQDILEAIQYAQTLK